jgi:hypothetical protein
VYVFNDLREIVKRKIFNQNGLRLNSSFQTGCGDSKPRLTLDGLSRVFAMLYIHYSGWSGTDRTRESAGLARGFAVWGLDRIFQAGWIF